MEADGLRIVFVEEVEGVNHFVFVAKETEDALSVFIVQPLEAPLRHGAIFLHQCFVYVELLHAVLTGILKLLRPSHAVLVHGVGYAQGRIGADAVEVAQLLGVHAAHRRAQDDVGLLFVADAVQQCHGFLWVYGQVGGNNLGIRKHRAQTADRA